MNPTGAEADEKLYQLFRKGKLISYQKGDVVGGYDSNKYAFYVESGYVRAYTVNNRGDEFTHIIYKAGESFPVFRMFEKGSSIYFQALSSCVVYQLPREQIRSLVPADKAITYALLRMAIATAKVYTNRVRNLEYRYASERIVYRLILMSARFGEKQPDGSCIINMPITQQLLATTINVSRESVNRNLDRLKELGIIDYSSKHFHIKDLEALKKQLGTASEE